MESIVDMIIGKIDSLLDEDYEIRRGLAKSLREWCDFLTDSELDTLLSNYRVSCKGTRADKVTAIVQYVRM